MTPRRHISEESDSDRGRQVLRATPDQIVLLCWKLLGTGQTLKLRQWWRTRDSMIERRERRESPDV